MDFLCVKQITFGEKTHVPGETIPDGVVLPERVNKLKAFGYITPVSMAGAGTMKAAQRTKKEDEESQQTKPGKKAKSEEVKA